jgi:heptosyltransferase-3
LAGRDWGGGREGYSQAGVFNAFRLLAKRRKGRFELTRALLIKLGGLGDLLVALPSIMLLRKSFPGARIDLVGRKTYGELLRERGVVDAVFSADDAVWLPIFDPGLERRRGFAKKLAGYDLILGWFLEYPGARSKIENIQGETTSDSRYFRAPGLPPFQRIIYDRGANLSISRYFFEKTAGFVRDNGLLEFSFEECAVLPKARVRRRQKFAVVHPGGGSEKKCWPLDRFLEVISFLSQAGYAGTVVTGEAEERLEPKLRAARFPDGWSWNPRPPLSTLADILDSAAIYIGNDSGVTHLAAACGAAVIAIFRKEHESMWRPFGRTRVLSAESASDIPAASVVTAIEEIF